MNAYIFPGQGAQYPGMGKELYQNNAQAKTYFDQADQILGFSITNVMFNGSDEDLKQTKITQPAIFLDSVIPILCLGEAFKPDMVAGHSLGEFSALTANRCLSFEAGLKLVYQRALAMQKACEAEATTMAAVLGLTEEEVDRICKTFTGVVAANYNCPGQIVISGSIQAIEQACEALKTAGAKRALALKVGGAFHSPFMQPATDDLSTAIHSASFAQPICPIYQNVDALPHTNPEEIKTNLLAQLTAPVRWSASVRQMVADGANVFIESGPGEVLCGLVKKIAPEVEIKHF